MDRVPSLSRSYGWVVDVDHLDANELSRVGVVGPRQIAPMYEAHLKTGAFPLAIVRWRCKDDDDEVYYEGRYVGPGDERMFGPLDDFARPDAGASSIEYMNPETGQWDPL